MPTSGSKSTRGTARLRAWADVVSGQLTGGAADIVLSDVEHDARAASCLPLALQSISGRLGGKRLAGGFEFETQGLQFQTRDGQRWPGGNLFVRWTQAEGNAPAQGELRADKLDLVALSQIASRLPLGNATHDAMAAYAPKGLVETLHARWQGPLDAPAEVRGPRPRLARRGGRAAAAPRRTAPARPASAARRWISI